MKLRRRDPLEFDVIADGLGFPEGPVIAGDGAVLAVDIDRGNDRRRAVITLSRSGRLIETTWPRPGLALHHT
jgi:hypothetical protein